MVLTKTGIRRDGEANMMKDLNLLPESPAPKESNPAEDKPLKKLRKMSSTRINLEDPEKEHHRECKFVC